MTIWVCSTCSHSFAIGKKKKRVSYKVEFTKGKIQRKKRSYPNLSINSEVQIVTIIEKKGLQRWDYYLKPVASAFCGTILLR